MSKAKSLAAAQYILDRCKESADPSVTPMQLIKMVYIAHGYMLGLHGTPLLEEDVEAWRYGPVVRSVYYAVRDYRSAPVADVPGAPRNFPFTQTEKSEMQTVAEIYGPCDAVVLSSATHKPGTPWSLTWERQGQNAPISNDLIEHFYRKILGQPSHSTL